MPARVEDIDRRIIPRWRRFRATLALNELGATQASASASPAHSDASMSALEERLSEWRANGGLAFASDALGTALVLGHGEEARDAAEFVTRLGDQATASARILAETVLAPQRPPVAVVEEPVILGSDELRGRVRALRGKIRDEPRNAIAWVDLAHEHTLLGNLEHAEKAIRMALTLGGENRFIIRSAARFLLHVGQPYEAHEILKRATLTRSDPWLLAAEIAVASSVNRGTRFAKIGAAVLADRSHLRAHTTELASALATLELESGKIRAARKLFQEALDSPTENSVAQAEWASRQNAGVGLNEQILATSGSFEARALEARAVGAWDRGLQEARLWFYDQPFSRHAASFASYLAGVPLELYDECAGIARLGLIATPLDPLLLNNLTFALSSSGRVSEAEERFGQIEASAFAGPMKATLLATQGLLYYRRGLVEQGRASYLQAIEAAKGKGESFQAALAAMYFAREATLAKAAHAAEARAIALSESKRRREPEIAELRARQERDANGADRE